MTTRMEVEALQAQINLGRESKRIADALERIAFWIEIVAKQDNPDTKLPTEGEDNSGLHLTHPPTL